MTAEIYLNALSRFQCLGDKCPRTCCQGWNIVLEPEYIARCEKLREEKQIDLLTGKVNRHDTPEGPVYTIKFREDNHCISLDENGLCTIHKELGPDYLSSICRSYPRYNYENNLKKLTSAFLSCPEVVRLALFEMKKMTEFRARKQLSAKEMKKLTPGERFAVELDNFGHAVIDSGVIPLNIKIFHIADVIVSLYTAIEKGRQDAAYFSDIMSTRPERLARIGKESLTQYPVDPVTAGSLWYNFFHFYLNREEQVAGFDYGKSLFMQNYPTDITSLEQYAEFYAYVTEKLFPAREYVRKNYADVFSRYLKISTMNKGFAWNPLMEDFVAGYLYVVMPFCLVQILLWIKYSETGELSDEFVTDVISVVERMTDHSDEIKASLASDQHMLELHRYHACLLEAF